MRWNKVNELDWHIWFAWFPIQIENKYIWLEYVNRKYDLNKNFTIIDPYDIGDYDGEWTYKNI